MSGDSIAFATVLALAALLASIVSRGAKGKAWMDSAAALSAALAVLQVVAAVSDIRLAAQAALVVLGCTPLLLALAVYARLIRPVAPVLARAVIAASALAGLIAVGSGFAVLAYLPLVAGVVALVMLALLHLRTAPREAALIAASAGSLIAAAAAFVGKGSPALSLFLAAALIGVALAVGKPSGIGVEQKRRAWARRTLAIRRKR